MTAPTGTLRERTSATTLARPGKYLKIKSGVKLMYSEVPSGKSTTEVYPFSTEQLCDCCVIGTDSYVTQSCYNLV